MRIHSVHTLIEYRLSISTKVFNARGSKVVRCRYCQIQQEYCICSHQPDIDTNVSALILMSPSEVLKPSNTGRLIADIVKETYTYQWSRTEPEEALLKLLYSGDYSPVIVFPEQYAQPERQVFNNLDTIAKSDKKMLFIFIDSNWREARKIFKKSEYLQSIPVLSIVPTEISQYVMRKSNNDKHLSTAEVASIVLQLAGEGEASKQLEFWFDVFKESYLLSKTRLKSDFTRPVLRDYLEKYN